MMDLWQAALPFVVGVLLWVIFVCSVFVVTEMMRNRYIIKKLKQGREKRGW